jgi:hypothetical protein
MLLFPSYRRNGRDFEGIPFPDSLNRNEDDFHYHFILTIARHPVTVHTSRPARPEKQGMRTPPIL